MTYTRAIHDTIHYSKRITNALRLDPSTNRLVAGVDSFFLDHPLEYPWNDKDVGCLPMISAGGRVLVRTLIDQGTVRVDYSVVQQLPTGATLQRRADNIMAHAITKYGLKPYQAKAGAYGNNPGQGWVMYATDDPSPQRHRLWFWYNLAQPPQQLAG